MARAVGIDLRSRLAPRRIMLEVTEVARRFVAQQGYDPGYGARTPRRFIAHEVETPIGRALFANDVLDGAIIRVHLLHGALEVEYPNPDEPAQEAA